MTYSFLSLVLNVALAQRRRKHNLVVALEVWCLWVREKERDEERGCWRRSLAQGGGSSRRIILGAGESEYELE